MADARRPAGQGLRLREGSKIFASALAPVADLGRLPRSPVYHSLDFWRGLACLFVVLAHSGTQAEVPPAGSNHGLVYWTYAALARGWVGVPIFFVISGYCVTAAADSTRLREHRLQSFFYRRFRRIYPPYWVWLAIVVDMVEQFISSGLAFAWGIVSLR